MIKICAIVYNISCTPLLFLWHSYVIFIDTWYQVHCLDRLVAAGYCLRKENFILPYSTDLYFFWRSNEILLRHFICFDDVHCRTLELPLISLLCNHICSDKFEIIRPACRWLIVENVKLFRSYVKHFWIFQLERNCRILIGLWK